MTEFQAWPECKRVHLRYQVQAHVFVVQAASCSKSLTVQVFIDACVSPRNNNAYNKINIQIITMQTPRIHQENIIDKYKESEKKQDGSEG